MKSVFVGLLIEVVAFGCGSGGDDAEADGLPTTPPTKVEMVTSEGFVQAGAVAASPDGKTFYVAANDAEGQPTIFAVDAATGGVSALHSGPPLLYPSDLSVSCDGSSIFVSDMGFGAAMNALGDLEAEDALEAGGIHLLSAGDGSISSFAADGIERAAGLIVSVDCSTLYVTGWTSQGQPAVFTVPVAGGPATVLYEGEPLVSPTGVHVDADEIAWVMDHEAIGSSGPGTLFAVKAGGQIDEVASGLPMGRHGGVSLTPGGVTAVIPVSDEAGSRLITANTKTGETAVMATPDIEAATGVAAAREAPVMVVAGENSISIATFDE